MFNFLSHLFLYWHLQKRWSRRALALLSWRLGARQPCAGTRPAASFPLSLLILISCFCKCPMAALGISLGGFSPAWQKAPGGPWACTWGRRGVGLGSLAAGKGIKLPAGLCCCCPGAEGLLQDCGTSTILPRGCFIQYLPVAQAEPFAQPSPGCWEGEGPMGGTVLPVPPVLPPGLVQPSQDVLQAWGVSGGTRGVSAPPGATG